MTFQLRPLHQPDHELIKNIFQDASILRHIGPLLTDEQVTRMLTVMLAEMNENKAVYQVITAGENEANAGLLSMHWHADVCSIVSGMIVLPEFQNQGVCKWAQMTAMKMIRQKFPVKTCSVFISADNVAAITSYGNMGFVPVKHNRKSKKHLNLIKLEFNMEQLKQ